MRRRAAKNRAYSFDMILSLDGAEMSCWCGLCEQRYFSASASARGSLGPGTLQRERGAEMPKEFVGELRAVGE